MAETIKLFILALGTFPGNLSSKELKVYDATHGSLALKAYQQNLYLKYYYYSSQATIA